jgi:hypothetical protein
MVNDVFDGYRAKDNTDMIRENINAKETTKFKNNNLDLSESNVTRAIKDSIERNSHCNVSDTETSFKQVLNLAKNIVNELPTMVNATGKTINKLIVKSKEGIESINNFKNTKF